MTEQMRKGKQPGSGVSRLVLQMRRTISKYDMLRRGEHVVVAVSGGADSIALLHALVQLAASWRLSLSAAHLNHQIRGKVADEDEEFVRKVCSDLDIACITGSSDVKKIAREGRINLEEAARETRYDFLRNTASRVGAGRIALGHTRNDQAETAIMRFLRGSGPEGMASIYPVVDRLFIRPLIECSRQDILRYIEAKSLPYRTDSSNRELAYSRNRVRHELIPYLEEHFNPRLICTLANGAEVAREVFLYLQSRAEQHYQELRNLKPEGISLPAEKIAALDPAVRGFVIRRALKESRGSLRGINASHVESILELCRPARSGRRLRLPGKCLVERSFADLLISRDAPILQAEFEYELPFPGRCVIRELGLEFVATLGRPERITLEPGKRPPRSLGTYSACLDAEALPGALVVRSRKPGDRYGGAGHRKVKKMLIDARINLQARSRLPLLVTGGTVAWIPGFKPAAAFQFRPESKTVAIIEVFDHR